MAFNNILSLGKQCFPPALCRTHCIGLHLGPGVITMRNNFSGNQKKDSPKHQSSKGLYKYLMREIEKLPKEAQEYYKNSVKQGFNQHADENDLLRIKEIRERTVEDAKWIIEKYNKKK